MHASISINLTRNDIRKQVKKLHSKSIRREEVIKSKGANNTKSKSKS